MARIWRGASRAGIVLAALALAVSAFIFFRYSQQIADSKRTPESLIYVLCDTAGINLVEAEALYATTKETLEADKERVAAAKQEAMEMMPSLMVAALVGAFGGSEISDSIDSTLSAVGESYERREATLAQSQGAFRNASTALETARSDNRLGQVTRISPRDPRWSKYLNDAAFAKFHHRELRPRVRGLAPVIAAFAAFAVSIVCSFLVYFVMRLVHPLVRWVRS